MHVDRERSTYDSPDDEARALIATLMTSSEVIDRAYLQHALSIAHDVIDQERLHRQDALASRSTAEQLTALVALRRPLPPELARELVAVRASAEVPVACVYVIEWPEAELVKIGATHRHLRAAGERHLDAMPDIARKLSLPLTERRLLGLGQMRRFDFADAERVERRIHRELDAEPVFGREWFRVTGAARAIVDTLHRHEAPFGLPEDWVIPAKPFVYDWQTTGPGRRRPKGTQ